MKEKNHINESIYTNQPVLLKVWKTRQCSFPSCSLWNTHETRWPARREIRVSSTWQRSNRRSSLTSTTKVSALMPQKLYHSTCFLRCLVLGSLILATSTAPPWPHSLCLRKTQCFGSQKLGSKGRRHQQLGSERERGWGIGKRWERRKGTCGVKVEDAEEGEVKAEELKG